MKKILAAILCAAMALSFSACSDNNETPNNGKDNSVSDSKDKNNSKDKDNSKDNSNDSNTDNNSANGSGDTTSGGNSGSDGGNASGDSKPEESSVPELPAAKEEDFAWISNEDGSVTITRYNGSDEKIVIPSTLDGKPVTRIGSQGKPVFRGNIDITSVTIPASVEYIYGDVFSGCINLSEVKFLGSTPGFLCRALNHTLVFPDGFGTFNKTPWLEAKAAESKDGLLIIGDALVGR